MVLGGSHSLFPGLRATHSLWGEVGTATFGELGDKDAAAEPEGLHDAGFIKGITANIMLRLNVVPAIQATFVMAISLFVLLQQANSLSASRILN